MNDSNQHSRSRRRFLLLSSAAFGVGAVGGVAGSLLWASNSSRFTAYLRERQSAVIAKLSDEVLPADGLDIGVSFGDSIKRLVQAGVISPDKFNQLYAQRGGLPDWVQALFMQSSSELIRMSMQSAPYLLNLLWPIGVATRTRFNKKSKLNGPRVGSFASTGGWVLGEADRGGEYFNSVRSVDLDDAQEAVVLEATDNTYRPCCNNSAFFQDCNHGSAMLGLYELAASQGAGVDELYEIGRIANSFWYPPRYMEMAYYFNKIESKSWDEAAAKTILDKDHSSISGWQQNVHGPLVEAGLLPGGGSQGGSSCGV